MFIFDPTNMLLSLLIGFSFVRAVVACAVLERTSGFELSSETTPSRYFRLVTVPSSCPFTLISLRFSIEVTLFFEGSFNFGSHNIVPGVPQEAGRNVSIVAHS